MSKTSSLVVCHRCSFVVMAHLSSARRKERDEERNQWPRPLKSAVDRRRCIATILKRISVNQKPMAMDEYKAYRAALLKSHLHSANQKPMHLNHSGQTLSTRQNYMNQKPT